MILEWIVVAATGLLICGAAFADHDEHRERSRHRDHDRDHHREYESEHHDRDSLTPVTNPTYKETCGACHFSYQPELLPSKSWEKILASPDDHFGESLELDEGSKTAILEYLTKNAANQSSSKRSGKIMRSLEGQTPLRITEIPYVLHKHHEIGSETFERKSIGSFSNCIACHKSADQGVYDDDDVAIPR